ncbi:MAG TPA: hypothetical protein VLM43_16570 [Desulfobacterales bacterium]|nr:hypothetical protein [Desulfobacterales bacterium]
MKIPEAALGQIQQAVMAMLPYENTFEPKTQEAKTILEIGSLIQDCMPQFQELEGFLRYMAKGIDTDTAKQNAVNQLFIRLKLILGEV